MGTIWGSMGKLVLIYRNTGITAAYDDEFYTMLEEILLSQHECVIIADFNLPNVDWTLQRPTPPPANKLMQSHYMIQHIIKILVVLVPALQPPEIYSIQLCIHQRGTRSNCAPTREVLDQAVHPTERYSIQLCTHPELLDPVVHPPERYLIQQCTHLRGTRSRCAPTWEVLDPAVHPPENKSIQLCTNLRGTRSCCPSTREVLGPAVQSLVVSSLWCVWRPRPAVHQPERYSIQLCTVSGCVVSLMCFSASSSRTSPVAWSLRVTITWQALLLTLLIITLLTLY